MRGEAACAGEVRTTVDAAVHTAATVSAARRADDMLGNGFLRERDLRRDEGGAWVTPCLRASISSLAKPLVKVSAMYGP
ncbi:hypothetical protein GCM10010293_10390 [Streptomyces griseoflavus]|nr:hypothetical protein GCM10010293_10390 [Streptomyces griseoflavus]